MATVMGVLRTETVKNGGSVHGRLVDEDWGARGGGVLGTGQVREGCAEDRVGDREEWKSKTLREDLQPGQRALQWILLDPYSSATCLVKSTTAPLDAQYAAEQSSESVCARPNIQAGFISKVVFRIAVGRTKKHSDVVGK